MIKKKMMIKSHTNRLIQMVIKWVSQDDAIISLDWADIPSKLVDMDDVDMN